MKMSEEILCEVWDNIKRSSIRVMGVPGGEESERERDRKTYLKK